MIELLVVVAIIGILSAIAIPQMMAFRTRAYDARVESDARNAATSEEAYYVDNDAYAVSGSCSALPGMNMSGGVTCTLSNMTCADGSDGFKVSTSHPKAKKHCSWASCGQSCAGGSTNLCCT
jgi:type II secretory pathway pseudopilin PulG